MQGNVAIRPLDLVTIVTYLGGVTALGLYFARRARTTEAYFLGNRAFGGWLIGLSLLGTWISSITFLAFPGAAFLLDWRELVPNLVAPFVAVFGLIVFIPFFRRGNLTSAFEYLEHRFGPLARLYGAVSFLALQMLRVGSVLYLVSIPVNLLTGLDIVWVIVIGGVFVAVYTVAGGIEAVVWTDAIQSVVLLAGGIACVLYIATSLPGGLPQILDVGMAENKFGLGSFEWDPARRTFWTAALLGVFLHLRVYASDQNVIQRYVASASMREARKATGLFVAMAVPTWTFFFFIGTCLFVFYAVFPDAQVQQFVADKQIDHVFPYFILTRMPAGIAGLVIAGVLAAAMSSLDSSLNAVATVTVVDIWKRYLARGKSDRFYLRVARIVTAVAAALMIGVAIYFDRLEKESMTNVNWIFTAIFGGCMTGLFLVGFFTTRVDYGSAMIGLGLAVAFNLYLMLNSFGLLPERFSLGVHAYWVGVAVNLLFAVTAYAASWIRRRPPSNLESLTVWTMPARPRVAGTRVGCDNDRA